MLSLLHRLGDLKNQAERNAKPYMHGKIKSNSREIAGDGFMISVFLKIQLLLRCHSKARKLRYHQERDEWFHYYTTHYFKMKIIPEF